MTGVIKALTIGSASGFIRAEDGHNIHFEPSSVLAYDVACLAVGQLVTFDLDSGDRTEAVNVYVQKSRPVIPAPIKGQDATPLRYVGFDQQQGLRAYRFERRSPGEETAAFVVTADLSLFAKHHVAIQEGPALCLRVLMTELESTDGVRPRRVPSILSEEDLLAHIARRPIPPPRRRPIPRKPTPASQTSGHRSW
jgi:cold shock CspA family protein